MFDVATEFTGSGEAVVFVAGELDMNSSDELRKVLMDGIDQGLDRLTVDLEDLQFIDSSGIATLVESLQKMRESGGTFVLRNLNDSVRSVFEIANLLEVFTIEEP